MPDYGLLPTGFLAPTVQEIRAELEAEVRSEFGTSLPLGDNTWLGHLIGILAERLALLWEAGQVSFSSMDVDKATAAALEALCLLSGTFRQDETPSTTTLTLTGDDDTLVPAGSMASTESTGKNFETTDDVTLEELDAWLENTAYAEGDRVTNSARAYVCITAGTSENPGSGPSSTDDDITDNTVHWRYMGEGDSAGDVDAESVDTGPIVALSGDINVIETPVGGWNSVINLEDAEEGKDEQTDEQLRITRELELQQGGTGTPDAIRASMLQVPGVTACTVFWNSTDVTDPEGMPPHSVEILVRGGEDEDIWQAVWENVPVGIQIIGDEEGTVVDDEGFDQDVAFSRPDEVTIWVDITLEKVADDYGGDDAVKAAIIEWGDAQTMGKNAVASAISAQAFGVDGVLDVSEVLINTTDPPVASTTIQITRRQLAVYDTSRITVNTSDGEP